MEHFRGNEPDLLCPSAKPEMAGSVVFGVVVPHLGKPCVAHLVKPQPVTDDLLALIAPVHPTEVLRFAAPCSKRACQHFDGADCRLAKRIVRLLPIVADGLPPCQLRPECRWWRQEGKAACVRCPQVVTEVSQPSPQLYELAGFATAGAGTTVGG